MIDNLIKLLIVGLVLALLYYVVAIFVGGIILKIALAIFVLIFIGYVLKIFGIGI